MCREGRHYADQTGGWGTRLTGQAGTITISTLTATRIVGTFSFVADMVSGGATGTKTVTGGSFDLPITTPVATTPVPNTSRNLVTATLGGQAYVAATVAPYPSPATIFGFASTSVTHSVTLSITGNAVPGTYQLGAQGSPAQLGVNGECTAGSGVPNCAWSSVVAGSSGTITIASMANGRATGTFSGTLGRGTQTGAATMAVASGAFDVGVP